jgi:hypothetical protein
VTVFLKDFTPSFESENFVRPASMKMDDNKFFEVYKKYHFGILNCWVVIKW